jgi:hypothetical protein
MTAKKFVRGFKSIASFIGDVWGITVTAQSAWRWSNAKVDPLPVRRIAATSRARPLVSADESELRAWAERRVDAGR